MRLDEVSRGEIYAWADSQWDADRGRAKPFTVASVGAVVKEGNRAGQRGVLGNYASGREAVVPATKLWGLWEPYEEKWAVVRRQVEEQGVAVTQLRGALEAAGLRQEQGVGDGPPCQHRTNARTDYARGLPAGVEVVLDTAGAMRLAATIRSERIQDYSADVATAIARADAALSVLTLSPGILAWLEANDRTALALARDALEALDAARAAPAEEVPV